MPAKPTGPDRKARRAFTEAMQEDLRAGKKHDKRSMEKKAQGFGITNQTLAKELTELAIVHEARRLAYRKRPIDQKFGDIVELYEKQVNLSHRTSTSMMLQQYSTPAPIGYLAGVFCGIDKGMMACPGDHKEPAYFEPSAGNGMMTIAGAQQHFWVNEVDETRRTNLEVQNYAQVWDKDASEPFGPRFQKHFDAVLTNPPFGAMGKTVKIGTTPFRDLDHLMAVYALDTMCDKGRAAIIIGGHTEWDKQGRIKSGKNRVFFNYLYRNYHVADVIQIDGKKLYSRMGTAFNTRLILINGRKVQPQGNAPLRSDRDKVVSTFPELFKRVTKAKEAEVTITERLLAIYDEYKEFAAKHPGKAAWVWADGEYWIFGEEEAYQAAQILSGKSPRELELPKGHFIEYWRISDRDQEKLEKAYQYLKVPLVLGDPPEGNLNWLQILELEAEAIGMRIRLAQIQLESEDGITDADTHPASGRKLNGLEEQARKKFRRKSVTEIVEYIHTPKRKPSERGLAEIALQLRAEGRPYVLYRDFTGRVAFAAGPVDKTSDNAANVDSLVGPPESLEGPYRPAAETCFSLETVVPDSMDFEIHTALQRIQEEIGMPLEDYVLDRLDYATREDLCNSLSAEQVDAVALAIYNIEYRQQGMIIGDQTGIGKGRVAASMIRYAVIQGFTPVFLTEKANLFSDLYRDLEAIGAGHLRPFIVNMRASKSHIKDQAGVIVYKAPPRAEQDAILESGALPGEYDFVMATYTQFNADTESGLSVKQSFLKRVAEGNTMVLDESHNASGSSQTGTFLREVLRNALGVTYLSATFAKRPDNMPVYGMKTAMSDANLSPEELVNAIAKGGVALQEIVASQLVSEGQMIRRERSFEGIEVNYITLDHQAEKFGLDDKEAEHRAIADNITGIMRGIIDFQTSGVRPVIEIRDKELAQEGKEIKERGGTSKAGIDNPPYFSKVFQIVNQMLMAIKAESVAELAIKRLREGKKPVIAFASTMESFFEDLESIDGGQAVIGDKVRADFAATLVRGLRGTLRVTEYDQDGKPNFYELDMSNLSPEAREKFSFLESHIAAASSGITISPIDHIKQRIEMAGFSVAEVTGRGRALHLDMDTLNPREIVNEQGELVTEGMITGTLVRRKRENVNDAFRRFNDNEVDVLMINQSGSTGASAHAIPTAKVPKEHVRQRVMIVLQPELDINTEVQKRGRINRTGQVLKPIYDYVISAIPAEKRLMMMLQKKLKSLDANTSSNQKQSEAMLKTHDFLNKYGDQVVGRYLLDNRELNDALDDPAGLDPDTKNKRRGQNKAMAHFVSGRVAVLATDEQDRFYTDITERYDNLIEELKQQGNYDLEVEVMDLQAKTISEHLVIVGQSNDSVFGANTILKQCEVRNLRKPFTSSELHNLIEQSLDGGKSLAVQTELAGEFTRWMDKTESDARQSVIEKYKKQADNIPNESKVKKLTQAGEADAVLDLIEKRQVEIAEAKAADLNKIDNSTKKLRRYLGKLFEFFYIGQALEIPLKGDTSENPITDTGIFLGFGIDREHKNPFRPSGIKLRFALASSRKYMVATASADQQFILAIKGGSDYTLAESKNIRATWEERTASKRSEWTRRWIVSGNILQAMDRFGVGRLVDYSTRDGGTEKGILLPEAWEVDAKRLSDVRVPLKMALPIFQSIPEGHNLSTNAGVSFIRMDLDTYQISVPAAKSKGGKYYLHADILDLVHEGEFKKVSASMTAKLPADKLRTLMDILQDEFSDSVTVPEQDFLRIKDLMPKREARVPKPITPRNEGVTDLFILELEAEALALKLRLAQIQIDEQFNQTEAA